MTPAIRIAMGLLAVALAAPAAPAAAATKEKTPDTIREDLIAAHCKDEAKKYYSFIHVKKRRVFERNCMERARR